MIFVTVGTHYKEFPRLIKRLDEIAPLLKEEIVIQRGYTRYKPKNCKSFDFSSTLEPYYKKARLVIMHGGSTVWEFMYKYTKPIIVVPRQACFNEHVNDHQVEFAEAMEKKMDILTIYDIKTLTPQLLEKYNRKITINKNNLRHLQTFLRGIVLQEKSKETKDE